MQAMHKMIKFQETKNSQAVFQQFAKPQKHLNTIRCGNDNLTFALLIGDLAQPCQFHNHKIKRTLKIYHYEENKKLRACYLNLIHPPKWCSQGSYPFQEGNFHVLFQDFSKTQIGFPGLQNFTLHPFTPKISKSILPTDLQSFNLIYILKTLLLELGRFPGLSRIPRTLCSIPHVIKSNQK